MEESMDKIAVISDIHGNLPALEAVLADIQQRDIHRIICLGDLVGKGPDSSKAIDIIKEKCEVTVMGNWDDFITKPAEFEALKWHQEKLSSNQEAYLKELPFSVEFMMSGKLIRMFHASPRSLYDRIQPWDSLEKRLSLFANTEYTENIKGSREPDVICYGDVHNAFIQHIKGKTLCNVGSVGNPLDLPQASYLILEGKDQDESPSAFSIQFVRIPYDIEKAIELARAVEMPDFEPYVQELKTARYRGLKN